MIRILAFLIAALLGPAPSAQGVQIEAPDRRVHTLKVTYIEPIQKGKWFVELNDGSAFRLRPCKMEDSNHCYWDARVRGNRRGRSFVTLRNEVIYIPRRLLPVRRPSVRVCPRVSAAHAGDPCWYLLIR